MIPPNSSVNPERFSEEEFPVWCVTCEYLLRGIADGNCPECGQDFKRSRLLVTLYVSEFGYATWKRTRTARFANALLVASLAALAVPFVCGVSILFLWKAFPHAQAVPMVDFLVHFLRPTTLIAFTASPLLVVQHIVIWG